MSAPVAKLGDISSHGGVIIGGATRTMVEGAPVARMGDMHVCPIYGHGVMPIIHGNMTSSAEGMPVARLGDTVACGAVIIGSAMKTMA